MERVERVFVGIDDRPHVIDRVVDVVEIDMKVRTEK